MLMISWIDGLEFEEIKILKKKIDIYADFM